MASPDTDELATTPLPAGPPFARQQPAPQARQQPAPRESARQESAQQESAPRESAQQESAPEAEAPTVEQKRIVPERTEPANASPERIEPADASPAAEGDSSTGSAKARGRWWRGFTGSLAAGLTVLAIGVLVVAVICLFTGAPGPGPALLIGHPVAATLALLAQRVADRRNGPPAAGAGLVVVLFTVSALTIFWLA
ncbi:hypothetical protein [Amycolatopsis sp. lyj-109]|uniref:hypothetical protein n=1 Tax=Amycolatopsis sp. lyj-109 TaxID=2789287 RepID=UPI00397BB24E